MMKQSNNTKRNYDSALKRFESHSQSKPQAIEYFQSLNHSSQKMLLAALKSIKNEYHSILVDHLKRATFKTQKVFTLKEMKLIKATSSEMSLKHKAIIWTMLNTGCRVFEVNLIWNEFNFKDNTLIIFGKGNKPAKIFINKELFDILSEWKQSPDFKTYSVRHLDTLINEVFEKAGVVGTTHDLRRSFATNLRDHNAPLEHIQQILRHTSINTTIEYIKMTDQDIFKTIDNQEIDIDEYINETNFRKVALDLILKNQEQAKTIAELKQEIMELKNEKSR